LPKSITDKFSHLDADDNDEDDAGNAFNGENVVYQKADTADLIPIDYFHVGTNVDDDNESLVIGFEDSTILASVFPDDGKFKLIPGTVENSLYDFSSSNDPDKIKSLASTEDESQYAYASSAERVGDFNSEKDTNHYAFASNIAGGEGGTIHPKTESFDTGHYAFAESMSVFINMNVEPKGNFLKR
jgi:hypothetical protein